MITWPYEYEYQLFVIPFPLIQPLFIHLVFFMCMFHQDSSTSLLTQERYIFLRPKHFGHHSFPMLLLLSGIPCLVKLDTFSQPMNLKLLWRPICLKPTSTTTSRFSSPPPSSVFWNYFNWCAVCLWVSVCVCVHMHACLCICVSSYMYVCVM